MNLRELESFLAVAEELHFGRAADRLHLAQPTVSESVRRLERQLGAALFDRTTRNVTLTAFGEAFRERARHAYDEVARAYSAGREMALRSNLRLVVGVASGDDTYVLNAIAVLARQRPHVSVEVAELTAGRQLDSIRSGDIDVAVMWAPPPEEWLGKAVLMRATYAAIVPLGHPFSARPFVTVEQLADEPLITWPGTTNPALYSQFAAAMDQSGKPWSLVATAHGLADIASRVVCEHGIGLVPAPVVEQDLPGVAVVQVGSGGPVVERALVWRRAHPHVMIPPLRAALHAVAMSSAAARVAAT